MRIIRRLAVLALLAGVLVGGWRFAALNAAPQVSVDFFFWRSPEVSPWVAILVAFGVGFGLCLGLCVFEMARASLVARRYRKTVARLEAEIHQLRTLSLAAADSPNVEREPGKAGAAAPAGGSALRGG